MKISDFLKSKEITHTELDTNFEFERTMSLDWCHHEGCVACGDGINNRILPSGAWTTVQYCWKCNRISIILEQDRMGGVFQDIIHIYKER